LRENYPRRMRLKQLFEKFQNNSSTDRNIK
jgi:hypothetical protein